MLSRPVFILYFLLLASCVQHSHDKIIDKDLDIDPEETLDYLNELSEDYQKNPGLYYQRAKVLYQSQSYQQAYEDINKAIELTSSSMDYYLLKGKIEKEQNNPQKAIESLLIAEKLGARDKKLYEILASEYLQLGAVKQAKAAVDRLIKLQQNGSSYMLQADVLLAIGDSSLAISSYKKAISQDRKLKNAYYQLANIYRFQKKKEEAGKIINTYLTIEPKDKDLLLQKGRLLKEMEAYDSAQLIYNELLAIDSTDYKVYYELSNLYYSSYQYDSSVIMANKAFALNQAFYDAKIVVARSLDRQGKFQEAIGVYEQILKQDSTHNLAATALDNLKRKVAYLWQMEQKRKALDSARRNEPPVIQKKKIDN